MASASAAFAPCVGEFPSLILSLSLSSSLSLSVPLATLRSRFPFWWQGIRRVNYRERRQEAGENRGERAHQRRPR